MSLIDMLLAWLVVVLLLVGMDVCSSIENTLRVLNGGIKISKLGTIYVYIISYYDHLIIIH